MKKSIFFFLCLPLTLSLLAQSKTEIQSAQKTLTSLGYNVGLADGILGSKSVNAIKDFQTLERLPSTGKLDSTTLNLLSIKQEEVYKIQQFLMIVGYDIGGIDGMWIGKTSNALKEFQLSEGLTPTGKIDTVTMGLLSNNCAIIHKIKFAGKAVATDFFQLLQGAFGSNTHIDLSNPAEVSFSPKYNNCLIVKNASGVEIDDKRLKEASESWKEISQIKDTSGVIYTYSRSVFVNVKVTYGANVPEGYEVPTKELSSNYNSRQSQRSGSSSLYLRSKNGSPSIPAMDDWVFSSGWMCFNCVNFKSENDTISFLKGGFMTTSPDDIRFLGGTECDINGIIYVFNEKRWTIKK